MSRKENKLIEKNIEPSSEFSRYIFEHTEIEESIPLDAELIFLPEFDDELKKFNLELGKKLESTAKKIVYIKIEKLRPKILSRFESVSLDMEAFDSIHS